MPAVDVVVKVIYLHTLPLNISELWMWI